MSYINALNQFQGSSDSNEGQLAGWSIIRKALRKPLEIIARNSGFDGSAVAATVAEHCKSQENEWVGWDALQGKVRDLREDPPVCDPTLVSVTALESALSVAATMLTIEASIFTDKV